MKKISFLKFHFFSYRFIEILLLLILIIIGSVFYFISKINSLFLYVLIPSICFFQAILGIYEKKENVNIFLNINIDRVSYLLCDFWNVFILAIINTLIFVGEYYLFTFLKIFTIDLSTIFFINLFLMQIITNRLFNVFTIYFNNISIVLLILAIFLFIYFQPKYLIDFLISFNPYTLLSILISGVLISEFIVIFSISKLNIIFKKSLSSR
ncbi:MAG TPA: hypothetical protein PKO43_01365 [Bacilli bacterium]|nr:hypothetical protein [Bacilli bacterium]HQA19514.1 hypothetical protein [Bacilli bacterium]HQD91821.1 hypothetical protein [Bacilli bacterium]